jgi:hypothetical protein
VKKDENSEAMSRWVSPGGSGRVVKRLTTLVSPRLPPGVRKRLRRIRNGAVAVWYRGDLIRLGEFFETDKWGAHWYLQHYQAHFQALRRKRINVLEIGVGGYSDPGSGGNSLRMWKAYFPKANIYGVDVYDKSKLQEDRIRIFKGDQGDETFLRSTVDQIGGVDVVIDDGSHINADVIKSFETLFPILRNPGIYAVEDTQTSYWPSYGGSSSDLNDPARIMGYFTRLAHSLNHEEILRKDYSPNDFEMHIVAMHFYHNLILIYKGENSEGSNEISKHSGDARTMIGGPPGPMTKPGA